MRLIHKVKCIYLKGSYSVEAAFIVPVIFGMLFAMLYVLFFFHDKAVLYGNISREVILVSEKGHKFKSDKEWQEKIQENLWIMQVSGGKLTEKKLYVSGYAVAMSEWKIPIIEGFVNKRKKIKIEVKHANILPGEALWSKEFFGR